MYSFPNLEPVCWSMSSSNCCFLTCIQISQKASQVVWYSYLLKNLPQFAEIYTVKGTGKINTAEVDCFLEFPCLFYDLTNVGNLMSDSSACSKSSLNILEFSAHVLLKPCLENFEHYFASVWDEFSCAVVWIFFGIAFSGMDWKLTIGLEKVFNGVLLSHKKEHIWVRSNEVDESWSYYT